MKYGYSLETDITVERSTWQALTNRAAEVISGKLKQSPLADLDIKLFYVPILMSTRFRDGYPPRSRRSIKNRQIFCSPQLDYVGWMAGDIEEKKAIYYNGLNGALIYLERFGATPDQINAFKQIIADRH